MEREILRSRNSVLILGIILLFFAAFGRNIHLGRSDPITWIVPIDFDSIQAAINNASIGDTIYVLEGTYYENLSVNKRLTLLGENRNSTIINGSGLPFNGTALVYITANNVTMTGFTVTNSGPGIVGIEAADAQYCEIFDNIVSFSGGRGIVFSGGGYNEAHENIVYNSSSFGGIEAIWSNYNIFHDNIAYFNRWGISTNHGSYNTIVHNTVHSNRKGIHIDWTSTGNSVNNNVIDSNSRAGITVLNQANNTSISENTILSSRTGIQLENTTGSIAFGNTLTDNTVGVTILGLGSNEILANVIEQSSNTGIQLNSSLGNHIGLNTIADSQKGIALLDSWENTIMSNMIINSSVQGIDLYSSDNNLIFHNNLINNTVHVGSINSTNSWNASYPAGGNFWDTYSGNDLYRGPNQNISGYDGIGDTPYTATLLPLEYDWLPLMGPFGAYTATGSNITVFPSSEVGLVFSNVTSSGETVAISLEVGPELPPEQLVLRWLEIDTSSIYSGNISLRISYDDSNLTLEEEETLRLMQFTPLLGDVNVDGVVDIFDIVEIAGAYGSIIGDPQYHPWVDLDGDGDVDIFDIVAAAGNYGEALEPGEGWLDITFELDTENNLIFAEAEHLSIYGVTRSR